MPDATIFSIDVAVAKARNTAYYADPNALQDADKVDDDLLIQKGFVRAKPTAVVDAAKVDVRETAQLAEYEIPVFFNKPPHQPHLENFFNTIRGTAKLNCPADEAFGSEYIIHKANDAIAAQTRLEITSDEVRA